MEIDFREITEENFSAILDMKQPPEQHFVAPNAVSLAQAWLYPKEAQPYAVYDGGALVGFVMLDWDEEERSLGLWRLMIAVEQQGKGSGQAAVSHVIALARACGKFDSVNVDYAPGNVVAEQIYQKLGFAPTGEIENGGIVLLLLLN